MKLKNLVYGAAIAAVYAVLTIALAPVSFGAVQCRISEALTMLPVLMPAAIPGLFVGCLISNLVTGSVIDIVFGSLTTLVAAFCTYITRKNIWIAMIFPVVLNAVIVGGYIALFLEEGLAVWYCMLTVGLGQLVACYGIGIPLYKIVKKYWKG